MATKTAKIGAPSAFTPQPLELPDAREAYKQQIAGILQRLDPGPEQAWRDEQLAFAGGMQEDPSRGLSGFGGALSNAFAAQSKQRLSNRQLEAQYLPQIMEFLGAQRQNDIAMNLAQQRQRALFGGGGADPMAGGEAPTQGAGEGFFADIARKFNIPLQAVIADYEFDGGRGIRALINERTKPDITFQDGVALDKTAIGQGQDGFRGFTPGVATSADGKTTVRLPTQGGGIRVVAPEGAASTFKQFQDIGNRSTADFQTEIVTPRGENPQMVTRSRAADLARGAPRPASPTAARPGDTDRQAIFAAELRDSQQRLVQARQAGDPTAIERAEGDLAALQREIAREGIKLPDTTSTGPQGLEAEMRDAQNRGDVARAQQLRAQIERERSAKPSVGLELESPAEAARAAGAVKTETDQYADQAKTLKNAKNSISQIDKAIKLLESGEATQSGIGAVADSVAGFFGKELPGMAAAEELKNIQGWVVANVPRMEGPQSNFDVLNYQTMAGVMGNPNLPVGVRIRAAKRARDMIASAAPQYFGTQDWDRDERPTSKPLVDPAAIRAERARRQGAK